MDLCSVEVVTIGQGISRGDLSRAVQVSVSMSCMIGESWFKILAHMVE